MASQEIYGKARKLQRSLWKELEGSLVSEYDLHKGGFGDLEFLSRLEPDGYWRANVGRLRWLFHVVPDGSAGFQVRLPKAHSAKDLPGAVSTGQGHKFVLTYTVVTLFQRKDGTFVWPDGWQWMLCLVLSERIVEKSNSIKIHELDVPGLSLRANSAKHAISFWSLVGNLEPDASYSTDAFAGPLTYGDVGKALHSCIATVQP